MPDGSPAQSVTNAQIVHFVEVFCESWDSRHAANHAGIPEHLIATVMAHEQVQRASLHFDPTGDKRAFAQMQRAEEVRTWLWQVMQDDDHDIEHRIKAADKLMKSYGGYIHRVQIDTGQRAPTLQRGLTDEQADSIYDKVLTPGVPRMLTVAASEETG